jgi:Flp pilus assembly protein TadD
VAAVLATAVITTILYLNLSSQTKNTQELYTQYAIHSALTTQRGGATDSVMRSAIDRFNNKQYAQALPLLTELVKKDSNDIELKLAKHISELETGKVANSTVRFRRN